MRVLDKLEPYSTPTVWECGRGDGGSGGCYFPRFFRCVSKSSTAVSPPSRLVRVGDALRVVRGEEVFELEVRGLSDTRGPASVAQALYAEAEASRAAREAARAQRAAERAGYRPPETRPDKRARRLIRALGDIDAL